MATVNLGSIKFNWQGAYNGATAYAVDDVVSSGGNSYVCIAATTGNTPPNATYWELMAQAGTDGTDLTSTLTTQGDILYRNASGLARLGAGTSGQVLQTGGTGANPSWGTVSSDFVKLHTIGSTSGTSQVSVDGYFTSDYDIYELHVSNIQVSSSNKFHFGFNLGGSLDTNANVVVYALHYIDMTTGGTVNEAHSSSTTDNRVRSGWYSSSSTSKGFAKIRVYQPLATTAKTCFWVEGMSFDGTYYYTLVGGGFYLGSTSNPTTGISLLGHSGANIAFDRATLYGLKH
jgi:hypothetical protein